jgi:hypothetical protein
MSDSEELTIAGGAEGKPAVFLLAVLIIEHGEGQGIE